MNFGIKDIENEDYLSFPDKFYAVDSSVYFSYEKVNKVDLLLRICDGKCVLTPKIEKEIFDKNNPLISEFILYPSLTSNFVSVSNKWIRKPKNYLNIASIFSSYNNGFNYLGKSYRDCFYIANTNYFSITSGIISFDWQYDFLKRLKKEADRELLVWVVPNSSNTSLLANDKLMVNIAKSLNISISRSVHILIKAVNNYLISFTDAENIYNEWAIIDPGSCIWDKTRGEKKLIEFEKIFST